MHLFQRQFPALDPVVEEGLCELIAYLWLQRQKNTEADFQIDLKQNNDDPVYGLIVHDGSSTYIHITHCPWCGVRLPGPKRDLWFDTLEKMGYEDPLNQEIPAEFLSNVWHRK